MLFITYLLDTILIYKNKHRIVLILYNVIYTYYYGRGYRSQEEIDDYILLLCILILRIDL